MKYLRSSNKATAALLCALLLGTPQAQAMQQIGKAVSSKPGETIPALSAGVGSLGFHADLSLSAPLVGNPAGLAPASGLILEGEPVAQPRPEAVTTRTAAADSALSETSLSASSDARLSAPIEGHAVAAAQTAAGNPRPARRLQFSLSGLLNVITVTAMLLGFHQSYTRDAQQLKEATRWKQGVDPALKYIATIPLESEQPFAPPMWGGEFYRFMHSIEGLGGLTDTIDSFTNNDERDPIWIYFNYGTSVPYDLVGNDRGKEPKPLSEPELRKRWLEFDRGPSYYYYHVPYRYFQYLDAAATFYLAARKDPKRWDTPEHVQQVYLDLIREVVPKHPRFDEEISQKLEKQARTVFDAINSVESRTKWFRIKHGIFGASMAAVTALMFGFGWLKRKAKSALSWTKGTASRSKGTPLMGAALFALPGPLDMFEPWIKVGIAIDAVTTAMFVAWIGYRFIRRTKFRFSIPAFQFSISSLFRAITLIAVMLGIFRLFGEYWRLPAPQMEWWRPEIESRLQGITGSSDFGGFLGRVEKIRTGTYDYIEIFESDYLAAENEARLDTDLISLHARLKPLIDAFARKPTWSEDELRELWRGHPPKPNAPLPSDEDIRYLIRAHEFYEQVSRNPPNGENDPRRIYLDFIERVEREYSPLAGLYHKEALPHLEEMTESLFDQADSTAKKEFWICVKLAALAMVVEVVFFLNEIKRAVSFVQSRWLKRKKL